MKHFARSGISLWVAFGVAFAGALATHGDDTAKAQEIAARYAASVGLVRVEGTGVGTCFICGPNLVATNYHVVIDPHNPVEVMFGNKGPFRCEVFRADPAADLCLLRVDGDLSAIGPAIPVTQAASPATGEPVFILGHDRGRVPAVAPGVIAGAPRYVSTPDSDDYCYKPMIAVSAWTNPGGSGGPVLTGDGRLVGINQGNFANSGVALAIPGERLYELLNSPDKGPIVYGHAYLGLLLTEYADCAPWFRQRMAPRATSGIALASVFPGEPGWGALADDDLVVKINGNDVRTIDDYVEILAKCKPGDTVALSVWRLPELGDAPRVVRIRAADAAREFFHSALDGYAEVWSYRYKSYRQLTQTAPGSRHKVRVSIVNKTKSLISSARILARITSGLTVVPGSVKRNDGPTLSGDLTDPAGIALGTVGPGLDYDPAKKPGERDFIEFEVAVKTTPPRADAKMSIEGVEVGLVFNGVPRGLDPVFLVTPWQ
jgi:S1-C subfamily serine protease